MPERFIHPNWFNQMTAITTADADTAVVTAKTGHRIFITDLIVVTTQAAALGSFTLTDDDNNTLFGPMPIQTGGNGSAGVFSHTFDIPLVNNNKNNQVEFDKTAAEDDWKVFISGYYAP